MTPPTDLTDAIAENAVGPKSATGDSGSMSQHSLPDQIAADKYNKSQAALARSPLGFRRVQLRPGGNADLDVRGGCY
jgi:hypothetical protein